MSPQKAADAQIIYAVGAYTFKGTRLTAGAYQGKRSVIGDDHTGALLGVDRSVGKWWYSADFQSGKNTFGSLNAGIVFSGARRSGSTNCMGSIPWPSGFGRSSPAAMDAAIMAIAAELGIPAREANLTRYDIWCADECFLTGTGAEVIPVVGLDGREIGNGRPGPVTRRVLEAFRLRVQTEGTRI